MMKSKKEMFADILFSANTDCVLKINVRNISNPIISAVDRISKNQIILKPTCLYGYPIKKQIITLVEIESVKRYRASFHNPLFVKLRYIKNNISSIRHDAQSLSSGAVTF